MSNIKIYGQKTGKTLLKITKEGDKIYEPITEYISLTINKIKQENVLLNNINNTNEIFLDDRKILYDLSVDNLAENTEIVCRIIQSFSYNDENNQTVCVIDKNNKLIPMNEGICIIEAVLYETTTYLETITNQIVVTVYKKDQDDLNITDTIEIPFNKTIKLSSLVGDSNATNIIYTSNDPSICTIVNDMLIARKSGRCIVTAIKKGNENLNDVKQEFHIKVTKIQQPNILLKNISIDNEIFVNPTFPNDVTVKNIQENGKIFYLFSDPNICLIKNGKLYGLSEGKCQIQAIIGETQNYLTTKTNIINLIVVKNNQSELTIIPSNELSYLSSISLTTTGGSTDEEVIYTTKNDTIKIINNYIFGIKYGFARVTASIEGNKMYNPIKKEIEFIVKKIYQPNLKIKNINEDNTIYVNPNIPHEIKIFETMENAKVKFLIINNQNVCFISNNSIIGINEGTCLIQAISIETYNYLETKSEPLLVKVVKNDQDPLIIEYDTTINYKETKYIKVYGGNSSNSPTITVIENDDNCIIEGNKIYGNKTGVCPILIKKDADFMYNKIEKTIFIEVLPIPQENIFITDINELNEIEVDPNIKYILDVSNINENPNITYEIISTNSKKQIGILNKNILIPLNEGTIDIRAITYMTNNYIETITPTITINVLLKSSANYIVDKIQPLYYNSSIFITVNGGIFNEEYELISQDPNLIVVGNEVFGKRSGTYSLTISKKATFMYKVLNKKIKINVYKIKQPNFLFVELDTTVYVEPSIGLELKTTNNMENANIKYIIVSEIATNNSRVATITGNKFFPQNEGKIILKAVSLETYNYLTTETQLITINVIKKEQKPLIIAKIDELFYGSTAFFSVSGGSIDSTIIFAKSNDNIDILLNKNTIDGLKSGNTKVTVTKKGNYMYNDVSISFNVLVKKIKQTIKLEDINSENILINEEGVLEPIIITGIKESPIIKYVVSNPDICIVNNNKIITLSEGRTTIKAILSETINYLESETNLITIDVIKINNHSFTIIPSDTLYINKTIQLKITSINKKSPIIIISNNDYVTINGHNITGNKYGISNLTITQKGDDNYEDLVTNYMIQIRKIKQNITLKSINLNNLINVDDNKNYELIVENVKENANITYNILKIENQIANQIPCYIKDNKVYPFTEGSCIIEAVSDETLNFEQTTSNQVTITIYKNRDLKDLGELFNINFNSLFDLNKLDPLLIYESNDNENCTIVNNILFGKKSGKYVITYFKSADRLFYDLKKTFVVNVNKITQTAILLNINENNTIYVNPKNKFELKITGIKENASIYYNILDNENFICSISNNNLIPLKSGKIIIEAYLSETINYLTTKINTLLVNILKNDQLPISINLLGILEYQGSVQCNVLGGSTDEHVILKTEDNTICSIINNTIIGLKSKTTKIIATKLGNYMYNDVIASQQISVKKIYQPNFAIIALNDNNTINVNPETIYSLKTSEVKEYSQINFYSSNNDICVINNNNLIPLLSGMCDIYAICNETENYLETKSKIMQLNIIKNNQSELIINYPPTIKYNESTYLQVNGGNTTNIIVPTINGVSCIIDENFMLTGTYVGTCNINFFKEGNFMYNSINKTITIDTIKINQQKISITKINETNEIDVDPELEIELFVENIEDNPSIIYEIISQKPLQPNINEVIKIIDNKLYSLNEGTAIIIAKCLETDNYLETITPEYEIKVNLKNAFNFTIDAIPKLYFGETIELKMNESYDKLIYEIKSSDNNGLYVNENMITGKISGYYKLTVTKLATFKYKSLTKYVNIFVLKIKQPSFSITNSNLNLLIDLYKGYKIETSIPEEQAKINYEIISNTSINGDNICIIKENEIFCLNEGKLIIKAICNETKNYLKTESSIVSIIISKNDQVPLSIDPLANLYVNDFVNLNVNGGSTSNENIYYINNNNCNIQNNKIYGVYAGISVIKILKKGNYMYNDVSYKFKLITYKIPQNVKLIDIGEIQAFSSETYNLVTTGVKDYANIEYKILDSSSNFVTNGATIDICKISGKSQIIGLNAGTCRIQGKLMETKNYLETLTNIITITVNKKTIDNLFVTQSDILYINSQVKLNIENIEMNDIKIIPNNNNLTISGNILYGIKPGNTILNLIKEDTENHKGFNINYNIKVNKLEQNIKLDNVNETNILYVNPNVGVNLNLLYIQDNANYNLQILESISGESDIKNENICSIVDKKLYVLGSGYCVIQASVYETESFNSGISNKLYISMKKNEDTKIDINVINYIYYLDIINLETLTNKSGDALLFEINNDNCEIINNTLIAKKVGKSTIKAYFMPTIEYEGAIRYYNIEVKKINQPNLLLKNLSNTNTFFVDPKKVYNLEIENIKENAGYNFIVSDLNVCKIDNNKISFFGDGECEIYFTTVETTNYLSTNSNKIKIKVNKMDQTNFNIYKTSDLFYGNSIEMYYSGGNTDSDVVFTNSNNLTNIHNCEIINNKIVGLSNGVCTIVATKEGNFMYNSISKTINIFVYKIYQPLFKLNDIDTLFVDPQIPISLKLPNQKENAIMSFELIDNNNIIIISNNSIFTQNAGTCKLKIICSETKNYLQTESNIITINVIKKQQKEIKITYPTIIDYLSETQLEILGGSTNNEFKFSYSTNNCSINENLKLKGLSYGNCKITILKEGNFMYENIEKTIEVLVNKIHQPKININLFNQTNEIVADPNTKYILDVLNINENPIIKYEIISMNSNNSNLIAINGNILIPFNVGETMIKAKLMETQNYLETETESIKITTIANTLDNYFIDKLPPLYYNSTVLLTVNGGEFTNDYVVKSLSDNISINNNILSGLKAGQTSLIVTYKANIKKINVIVDKIEQPKIEMIDLSNNIFVNPNVPILLQTTELFENPTVTYRIVNNNGIDGQLVIFNKNNFFPISSGQFKFYAITSETTNYLSTKSDIFIVNINKNDQNDLVVDILNEVFIDKPSKIIISGGNTDGLITYKTDNNFCSIQDNIIYGIKANLCKITVTKFGNATYNNVSKTIKFFVGKANQKVKLLNINNNNVINVNPFNGPELLIDGIKENANIAYNVVDIKGSKVCKISSDKKILAINEGICTIEALLYETDNYLATKTNKITITVLPLSQDQLIVEPDNILYYDSSVNLLIYDGNNNNDEIIEVTSNNKKCDISGTIIYGLESGTCLLTITKKNKSNNKSIMTTYDIKINKKYQSLILEQINDNNKLAVNDQIYLNINNLKENANLSYIINQEQDIINQEHQICYIDNRGKLTAIKDGTCTIQAISSETTNYLSSKSNLITLIINKKEETKINTKNLTEVDYNSSIKLNTISGNIINTDTNIINTNIIYTSSNKNCEIISDTLLAKHSGTCIIYAAKKDDVTLEFTIKIKKIKQVNIILKDLPNNNNLFVNPEYKYPLELLNIKENASYKFYISDSNICNIENNNLIVKKKGTCEIYFETYETDNYLETKSNIIKIIALKNNQIPLIYSFKPEKLFYKSSIQLISDGGSTKSDVILTNNDQHIEINNLSLVGLNNGYSTITVFKEGDELYNDINDTIKIYVNKIKQSNFTLLDINNTNTIFVNPNIPLDLNTTFVEENATINYQIKYPFSNEYSQIATINGNQLYANFSGQCTIKAISLETTNYVETHSNIITITIIKNDQDDLEIKCPEIIKYNKSVYIESYGGNTENKIIYNIDNNNCIIDENNKLKGNNIGKSIITVFKEGNFMYNSISKNHKIEVVKTIQNDIFIEDLNELNEIEVNPNSKYYLNVSNVIETPTIKYEIVNSVLDSSNTPSGNLNTPPGNLNTPSGNLNTIQVCSLSDNIIIPLNSGYVEIKAKISETTNYLETETPIIRINILLSNPSNFIVDKLPILVYKDIIKVTLDNNKFNLDDFKFTTNSQNISVNNNIITGLNCGIGYLFITKKELTKKIKITVKKINQPKIEITNINNQILINPSEPIIITTNDVLENANIIYKILSYNVLEAPGKIGFINGNKLTTLNIGTFLLQAIAKETANYLETESPILNVTINKNEQTNLNINLSNNLSKGENIPYTVIGGTTINELKVIVNNDNCFITDTKIYGIYAGQSKITFIRPGNFMYNDVQIEFTININKTLQPIILNDINKNNQIYISNKSYDFILSNILEQGNVKFINKSNNDVCLINNNKIIGVKVGKCIIQAIISETKNYKESFSNELLINVNNLSQDDIDISFDTLYYNSYTTINANTNILISTNSDNCTISGNIVYGKNAGKCLLNITKINNNINNLLNKTIIINVNKIKQNIKLNQINENDTIYIDQNKEYLFILDGVQENAYINYISTDISVINISNNQVYALSEGSSIIYAIVSETENYLETESNKITINVLNKKSILDSDTTLLNIDFNGKLELQPFNLTNSNYREITYEINNTNCKIINNTVFGVNSGYCNITAKLNDTDNIIDQTQPYNSQLYNSQPYNSQSYNSQSYNSQLYNSQPYNSQSYNSQPYNSQPYNSQPYNSQPYNSQSYNSQPYNSQPYNSQLIIYSVKINKIKQPLIKISLDDYDGFYYINPTVPHLISISQINENANINYIVSNNLLCRFEDNNLYILNEGEITIYLKTSETKNYLSSVSNKLNLRFIKNNQAELSVNDTKLYYNKLTELQINGGSLLNLPIITSDSSNCKIISNKILGVSYGLCTINILKEGNYMYNPIQTSIKLIVNKIEQPNFIINDINKNNTIYVNQLTPITLSISKTIENPIILTKIVNTNSNISMNGLNLYANMEGICTIIAVAKETTNYLETQSKPLIINVIKNKQDPINIIFPLNINYKEKVYIQSSGGNTELPIMYKTSNNNCIIDLSNNLVVGNTVGSCVITSYKDGDYMYQPISKKIVVKIFKIKQQNIFINKFNELNELQVDPNKKYPLNISNIDENPIIKFIIVNQKPIDKTLTETVKLVDNQLICINEGFCQIKAVLGETTNYIETETQIIDIIIKLNNPNEFIIDTLKPINYGLSFTITVNDGYFNINEYDIVPDNLNAFNISDNVVIPLISGTQKINVIKRSTAEFKEFKKILNVQINKIDQPDFKITKLSSDIYIDLKNPYIIDTTQIKEMAKVTYEIISNSPNGNIGPVCKINNNNLFGLNLGTCLIQAVSSETTNYNKTISPVFILSCHKNDQRLLEINEIENLYYNSYITLSVFGGSTNIPVQVRPLTDNCYVKDNILYGMLAGKGKISLYKPGNNVYNDITMTFKINIYKSLQEIKLININDNNEIIQGSNYDLVIEGVRENAHIKYNILNLYSNEENTQICYFINNKLVTVLPGVVIIEASTFETLNYLPTKTNQMVITIKPQKQKDINIIPSDSLYYMSYITLNVTGGSTQFNFTIKSKNNNCIIDNNKIYGNKSGKCVLTVEKTGNTNYEKITKDIIINVQKIKQTPIVEILNIKNNTIYADNNNGYTIKINNVFENPIIKYNIILNNNNCCEIINNKIYGINNGYFILNVTTKETTNYLETTTPNIQIFVIKQNQNEIITDIINEINYNDSFILNTSGGTTEKQFEYKINGDNCIIENDMLIGKKAGICKLIINKKGDNSYNDITKELSIKVNKIYQTEIIIKNINDNNIIFVNPNLKYKLEITGIHENPNINYKINNYNIGNIIDGYLYAINEGSINIYVITSETENYLESKSNVLTIKINKNEQAPFSISLSNKLHFNGSSYINILGGSVLEDPIYQISNNNVKIINNTVIGTNCGTCEIIATKPGNFMYEPITSNIFIDMVKIYQPNFTLLNINSTNTINCNFNNPIKLEITNVLENPLITYEISKNDINFELGVYVINGYLYAKKAGTYFITACTTETDNYSVTRSNKLKINVVKKEQNKLDIIYPINLKYLEEGYISIKGGNTINYVIIKSTDANLIIENNKIIGKKIGTYKINIIKEGNESYLDINTFITINIIPLKQTNITLLDINQTNEIMINTQKELELSIDGIMENANYKLIIVKNIPTDINQKDVCIIQNNKLVALNIGTCIVKAIIDKTNNYLETETNEIKVTVLLNDSLQFFIDRILPISINKSGNITINNSFDNTIYKIKNENNGIRVENNTIYGIIAGYYSIEITNVKTNITKKIHITINKIKQPNFKYLIENTYFVNPTQKLNIKLDEILENSHVTLENSHVTFKLLSNNPVGDYLDDVCIIRNGIYALNQGKCIIKAIANETKNYATTEYTFDINIIRNKQEDLVFDTSNNLIVDVDSFIDINISGGSTTSGIKIFNEDNNSYIVNNRIYGIYIGKTKLYAYIEGNQIYEPITKSFDLIINKKYQNAILQPLNINNQIFIKQNIGYKLFIINIKENAKINYQVTNGYIKNNMFYPNKPGKCTIKAILNETSKYKETETNTIDVIANSNLIDTLDIQILEPLFYNSKSSYQIISNNPDEQIKFNFKSDKCNIKDKYIYGLKAGKCLVTAYKNGLNGYIIYKDFVVNVQKIKQNVILQNININNTIFVNDQIGIDLVIIGINDNPNINFIIKKLSGIQTPCYVNNNKLYGITNGSCNIYAILGETNNYLQTNTNSFIVTVLKNDINDIKLNTTGIVKVNESINLNFSENNNISLISNNDNCIVTNNNLIGIKTGMCVVTLNKEATSITNKFIKNFIVNVIKNEQKNVILQNINNNNIIYVDDINDLEISEVLDNAPVIYKINSSYNSKNNTVCVIENNKLIAINEGLCYIFGIVSETDNFKEYITNKIMITVLKKEQKPLKVNDNIVIKFNENIQLDTTSDIKYVSNNNNIKIIKNILYGINAGTSVVQATKLGNEKLNDITTKINVTVNKIYQQNLIIVGLSDYTLLINKDVGYKLIVSNAVEKPNITFEIYNSTSKDVCNIDSYNTLYALKEGSCYIKGITTETTNYLSTKTQPIKITVIKNNQNDISFTSLDQLSYNGFIKLNIEGSDIDTSVKYTVVDSSNCLVVNNILYGKNSGTCIVKALKEGNDLYNSIETNIQINIYKIYQPNFILYDISNVYVGITSYLLKTTEPFENANVYYKILTSVNSKNQIENIVYINKNKLYALKSGVCIIQAITNETNNYLLTKSNQIIVTVFPINLQSAPSKPKSNVPVEMPINIIIDMINAGLPVTAIPIIQNLTLNNIEISSPESIKQLINAGVPQTILNNIIQIANNAIPIPVTNMPIVKEMPNNILQNMILNGLPPSAINIIQQLTSIGIPLDSPIAIQQLNNLGISQSVINNIQTIASSATPIPITSMPPIFQIPLKTVQDLIINGVPPTVIPVIQQLVSIGIPLNSSIIVDQLTNLGIAKNVINTIQQLTSNINLVIVNETTPNMALSSNTIQKMINDGLPQSAVNTVQQLVYAGISLSSDIAKKELFKVGVNQQIITKIQEISSVEPPINIPMQFVKKPPVLVPNIVASSSAPTKSSSIAQKLALLKLLQQLQNKKNNIQSAPITSVKAPITSVKTPTKSVKAPTKSVKAPTKSVKAPTTSVKAPTTSVKAPTKSVKAPTKSVKAPTTSVKAPTKSVKAPTTSVKAPTKSVKAPTKSVKAPTKSVKAPTKSSISPSPKIVTPTNKVTKVLTKPTLKVVSSSSKAPIITPLSKQELIKKLTSILINKK